MSRSPADYERRPMTQCAPLIRVSRIAVTLLALVALSSAAVSQTTAPTPEIRADYEKEPDLAGLLAATRQIRMADVEPGFAIGTGEYAPYGVLIHVFDFAQIRFTLSVAEQKSTKGSRAPEFLGGETDVFAINGGFFERTRSGKLSPSGLLIADGRILGQAHNRAGSGVIYSGPRGVGIAYRKNFKNAQEVGQAVQVGPILVDPGGVKGIYKNVGGRFNRSAICLRDNSFTAFVVEGGLSLFQFADILSLPKSDGGFGCDVAINLDGGPSTQAALRAGSTRREIAGGTTVHNALVVSRRSGQ